MSNRDFYMSSCARSEQQALDLTYKRFSEIREKSRIHLVAWRATSRERAVSLDRLMDELGDYDRNSVEEVFEKTSWLKIGFNGVWSYEGI